jgi:hypothetical protein
MSVAKQSVRVEASTSGQDWVCASRGYSGVMGTARLQGLIGKVGKDPKQRKSVWECDMPTILIVQGRTDQVVVAMIFLITRGRSAPSKVYNHE